MEFFRLHMCGGRNLSPPDSDENILGIHAFCDTKINFNCAYLDTDRDMHAVAFTGVGATLMSDIPVHGIMERLVSKIEGGKSPLQNVNHCRPQAEGRIGTELYINEG